MNNIYSDSDFLKQLKELEDENQQAIQPIQPIQPIQSTIPNQITVTSDEDYTGNVPFKRPNQAPRKKSISELERDPEFSAAAERFLEGIGKNENIFEYLRDSDYSLSSAIVRSFESGNWTQQQKQDYAYLREQFDNAELRGVRETLGFARNFAWDLVGDPLNLLAMVMVPFTGGTSFAAKEAARVAAQQGVKTYIKSGIKAAAKSAGRPAGVAALEGASFGGIHNYMDQSTDVNINVRDEIDWGEVGLTTALGGTIGGTLGGVIGAGMGSKTFVDKLAKYSDEDIIIKTDKAIDNVQDFVDGEKFGKEATKVKEPKDYTNTITGLLSRGFIEKPTQALAKTAKTLSEQDGFKKALNVFRYDAFDTMTKIADKGKVRTVDLGTEEGFSFGEDAMVLKAQFRDALGDALKTLDRWGWMGRISKGDERRIRAVIQNPQLKEYEGQAISPELIEAAMDIKENVLKPIFKLGNKVGVFSKESEVLDYFPRRFNYSKVKKHRDILEKLIIKGGHADPIDVEKAAANKKIFDTDILIREGQEVKQVKGVDVNELVTDENVFNINFVELAKTRLSGRDADEETILNLAKKLKAEKIVDDMLERKYVPFETFSYNDNYSFLQSRVFTNIDDADLDIFLEDGLENVLDDYITSAAEVITRAKYNMRTLDDFRKNYIYNEGGIADNLEKSGGMFAGEANEANRRKVIAEFEKLYSGVTGVGEFAKKQRVKNKYFTNASDFVRLSQQLAHLPLVTVSSITEPLILLSRVPTKDSGKVMKDIGTAIGKEFGGELNKLFAAGYRSLTGKSTKASTLSKWDDATWREAHKTGLAMEQAIVERLEGMTGDALQNQFMRNISNGFFKATLLEQWTKAVQLASFTTGKRLIRENTEQLYKLKNGTLKLKKKESEFLRNQLAELGIDADDAVNWYSKSLDEAGNFNQTLAENQTFYTDRYMRGASRFTNEVILQPTAAMANKPLWFNSAAGQLLMQFAGYPTVFTNTVLKKFSNQIADTGGVATPRVLTAALLMTGGAFIGNTIRSKGESLREDPSTQVMEAIRRWGGLGALDYGIRFRRNIELGDPLPAAAAKTPFGPAVQDAFDWIQSRKSVADLVATNFPGYAAWDLIGGPGAKADVRSNARQITRKEQEFLKRALLIEEEEKGRRRFTEGGLVEGITDISEDEQMDRLGLSIGGPLVSKLSKALLKKGIPDKRPSAYHGSPTKFDEFDDLKKGGAMEDGVGYYFTDVEDYAKTFAGDKAGLKNVYKTKLNVLDEELINPHKGLKVKAMLDRDYGPDSLMSKKETDKIIKAVKNVQKDLREKGFDNEADKLQDYLDSGNLYKVIQGYERLFSRDNFYNPISDTRGTSINLKYPLIQDALKEQGFKGLKIEQNYRVNPVGEEGIFKPQTTYVLFDKKDIQDLTRKEFGEIGSRASSDIEPAYMGLTRADIREATSFDEYYNNLGEQIPNAFVMRMPTKDYLKLTTSSKKQIDKIKKEVEEGYEGGRKFGKFNPDKVDDRSYPIYLYIDKNGKVLSHEGRHRAALVEAEGGNTVPVVIHLKEEPKTGVLDTPMSKIKKPKDLGIYRLINQFDNDFDFSLRKEDVALVRRLNFREDIDNAVSVANQSDRLKFAKGGTPITLYYIGETSAERLGATEGGLVKGLVDVPNVKDNPADTINKTTGLTYSGKTPVQQQMDDLLEEIV